MSLTRWKMSAELNSKNGARSDSMGADTRGSEPMAGYESEAPMTQASLKVGSAFGPNAADSVALDGTICSGSKAIAATGTISWM